MGLSLIVQRSCSREGREGECSWMQGAIGDNQEVDMMGKSWIVGGDVLNDIGCERKGCRSGQKIEPVG